MSKETKMKTISYTFEDGTKYIGEFYETAGIDNLNEGDVVSFEVVSENGKEKASDLKIV